MSASSRYGDLKVSETVTVPASELREHFVRASGPGGQNVNKVSSAVQLKWNVSTSSLTDVQKNRIRTRWRARLSEAGDIIIDARTHRSQALNRDAARSRLASMIATALRPQKKRVATRPGRAAIQRRLDAKKQRSRTKAARRSVRPDAD